MVLKRFLGSRATRSLTVLSVVAEAKRSIDRGHRVRAALLIGVAALSWKWTLIGVAGQGVLKLLRGGRSSAGSTR